MKIEFEKYDDFVPIMAELSLSRQILFAASICERILPLYITIDFEDNFNHKTFPILRKTLDYIWLEPARGNLDKNKLESLMDSCDEITNNIEENELCNTEENTAPYAIRETLGLALTENIAFLRSVIFKEHSVLWDALNYQMEQEEEIAEGDRWSSKSLDEHFEIIKNHDLTKREMQKEMDDWIALKNTSKLTKEFIKQFREASDPSGKGMLESYNP